MFRVVRQAKGLRLLFKTLVISLPALGNISLLLLLVYFVFSVLGVEPFGGI